MRINSRASFLRQTILVVLAAFFSLAVHSASVEPRANCGNAKFAKPNFSPDLASRDDLDCNVDATGTLNCNYRNQTGSIMQLSLPIYSCPRNDFAFPRCAGYIEFKDEQLVCRKISEESKYASSCFACSIEGTKLRCNCFRDGRGAALFASAKIFDRVHIASELDLKDCDAPISSCDGILQCGECPDNSTMFYVTAAAIAGVSAFTALCLVKRMCWSKARGRR